MLIEDFIIEVYCAIEEGLAAISVTQTRKRGFAPKLSDAETLTLEMAGAYLGYKDDKSIWRYFRQHWQAWFPQLGSRSNFVRQSANLWQLKQMLHRHWVDCLGATGQGVYLIDGFPIPVCHFRRAKFSKVFKGAAAYGHCASKAMTYYGFKGMLLTNADGVIVDVALVAANVDERDAADEFDWQCISGMVLGDKGFIRPALKQRLAQQGINLQTPNRGNMKESRPKRFLRWMTAKRRLVETVIGQMSERFAIEANGAQDLWHLTSRIYRKVAAHTLCMFLNRHAQQPLAIEHLINV